MFGILGRELTTYYSVETGGFILWRSFYYCRLKSVDLSAVHTSESYSFSGTSSEKSQTTAIFFTLGSSGIDFIPKEAVRDFPNLNGLAFAEYNSPKLKNNVFTENFKKIEYLHLLENQIKTIESDAFEHLPKLKWINLAENLIKSLPFQIFRHNPEMVYINFSNNQIVKIHHNFFSGLNKLKLVDVTDNDCVDEEFGCETCLVSVTDLKTGLSNCSPKIRL